MSGGYTGAAGKLTRRQGEVLALARAGKTRAQIAAELGVTEETVKTHLDNIRARVDTRIRLRDTRKAARR